MQRTASDTSGSFDGSPDGARKDGFGRQVLRADQFAIGEPAWSLISPGRDRVSGANVDSDERPYRTVHGVPGGFVHLDGAFVALHHDEIERLLLNEAERTAEDNPLARIMEWGKDEKGRLMISTTTEHLAQRLGHALKKAYDGEVRYDFSHENKLAHVWWHRD